MSHTIYWTHVGYTNERLSLAIATIAELVDKERVSIVSSEFEGLTMNELAGEGSFKMYSGFCKTSGRPWTQDVIVALIILVDFGIVSDVLSTNDEDVPLFLNALGYVVERWPLQSYYQQKEYFYTEFVA